MDSVGETTAHVPLTDTVKQTIVETIEAPRLTDINVSDFVTFKDSRALYERKVKEKNEDSGMQIPLTTYRSSIDESVLELFLIANWIEAADISETTDSQIKDCIEKRASVQECDYDLGTIERDIQHVCMDKPCHGANLEQQVWRLCLKYKTTLKKCGYDKFVDTKPKLAIRHVFRRLNDKQLKTRMKMILDLHKEEYREDFHKFIRKAAEEAKAIDLQFSARRYSALLDAERSDDELVLSENISRSVRLRSENGKPRKTEKTNLPSPVTRKSAQKAESRSKLKRKFGACLNPDCGEEHRLADCQNTSPELKKKLREQFYAERKRKRSKRADMGTVGGIAGANAENHTSLFSASFCNGAVESMVMADQGSDGNIIPPSLFRDIQRADNTVRASRLKHPVSFSNPLLSAEHIRCSHTLDAPIRLRIRHGSSLSLTNMVWYVADKELGSAYIGRHVLAAIGLDNRKLLQMACDRFKGSIDIDKAMKEDGQENRPGSGDPNGAVCGIRCTSPLYGSTFHSQGEEGSDCMDNTKVYIDLGEDTQEELDAALQQLMRSASDNGMSSEGLEKLRDLLDRHRSIFGCGWEKPDQPQYHLCGYVSSQKRNL